MCADWCYLHGCCLCKSPSPIAGSQYPRLRRGQFQQMKCSHAPASCGCDVCGFDIALGRAVPDAICIRTSKPPKRSGRNRSLEKPLCCGCFPSAHHITELRVSQHEIGGNLTTTMTRMPRAGPRRTMRAGQQQRAPRPVDPLSGAARQRGRRGRDVFSGKGRKSRASRRQCTCLAGDSLCAAAGREPRGISPRRERLETWQEPYRRVVTAML